MRLLLLLLWVVLAAGCAKQEPAGKVDMARLREKIFNMSNGEQIRLLAAKHQIPSKKADAIALEYFKAIGPVTTALLMEFNPGQGSSSASNPLDKVTKVVSELAARHELKEEAVAAFLVDLRLYERVAQSN